MRQAGVSNYGLVIIILTSRVDLFEMLGKGSFSGIMYITITLESGKTNQYRCTCTGFLFSSLGSFPRLPSLSLLGSLLIGGAYSNPHRSTPCINIMAFCS